MSFRSSLAESQALILINRGPWGDILVLPERGWLELIGKQSLRLGGSTHRRVVALSGRRGSHCSRA
jgi:hypothetical protein